MKVWVDPERCQGHTLCSMIAPEAFELDDIDGHSSAVFDEVPRDLEDKVREAAQSCPECAIFIDADSCDRKAEFEKPRETTS
ncbi:ferredoxin [Mycobacterium heckeshornense]|uniref:Ferredoxin n=1 Tax=Mycobacterium heckeshornense TaxID=110505 RepID=A0A2G8B7I3_9MYCO|nr:ferredoxin [Mycobacterium heckeshornense]KMV23961.1 ferredoxin [Mycobacterium heckeshornense]MCV7036596.1 ferredoxin [Mycobacterium heckeshornense]PIJ33735.1 ferredoxin [Mycobacterium heckeshornense]BCO34464.1 ferredoxin [Mycobacterium heckeshornense]BCQ07602.1 ferredoxin [Mycobacterium heckeshornense]